MKQRLVLGVLAMPGVLLVAPAQIAFAAPDARLGGDFTMRGEITSSRGFIGQKAGDRITRIYKFRPRCATGVCNVTFRRQRGDMSFIRSIARRVDPGVYKAVDKARSECVAGGRVRGHTTVTTRTRIVITRAVDGKARKISATLLVTAPQTPGCISRRQTTRLNGTRR